MPGPLLLYTSPHCGLCDRARRALAALGVFYTETDTPDDHAYRLRTPVLVAGGEVLVEGDFDLALLGRILGKSGR